MAYTDDAKNAMLAQIFDKTGFDLSVTHISLHTSDPGSDGSNEVDGGGYSRLSVDESDFSDPSEGSIELLEDMHFDGPPESSVSHYGLWDGSTFIGGRALSGNTAFSSEGNFTILSGVISNILD